MGKFGNKRIPKFMSGEPIPESHTGVAIHPEILSLKGHGDDHAMIIIKTHDGQEVELRFDYDGDGMLTAQHGDHEYSIPVEVEIVSDIDESAHIDKDVDKKESMKKGTAAKTFESFVNECWNPMEEGYSPAMSEEAREAIKKICEDLLIKEAQACDEDRDPAHTYENYLNECGSYMTECMMEAAASLKVDESDEDDIARKYHPSKKLRGLDRSAKNSAHADFLKDPEFYNPTTRGTYSCMDCGAKYDGALSKSGARKKCNTCNSSRVTLDPDSQPGEMVRKRPFRDYEDDATLGIYESTAYRCDTCGERAEHEEIEENPKMRCSNCGDRSWSPEY